MTARLSAAEYRELAAPKKRSKHNARAQRLDGIYFPSTKEAKRYLYLKTRQTLGEIHDLKVHHRVPITIAGLKVCEVEIDFAYHAEGHGVVWEDVKGQTKGDEPAIKLWKLKHRLVEAVYGIKVQII
jgi:hypothetical protein